MQAQDIKQLVENNLDNCQVEVQGEGCNFQLNIISDELAALSPVKRQQAVYAVINPLIANGSMHAVTMRFFTQAKWQAANA